MPRTLYDAIGDGSLKGIRHPCGPTANNNPLRSQPQAKEKPCDLLERRQRAARLLAVVADVDRLELLEILADSVHRRVELDYAVVAPLEVAGLLAGDDRVALTPAGREVWLSVRGIVR